MHERGEDRRPLSMRRIANLLLLAAVACAVLGARMRVAWLTEPDVPQWGALLRGGLVVTAVITAALGVLAFSCGRPGGAGGVLLVGGLVQAVLAGSAHSPDSAEIWRWNAPWLVALIAAAWLPPAFSIARTAELSLRSDYTIAFSFRVAALVAFLGLTIVAFGLQSGETPLREAPQPAAAHAESGVTPLNPAAPAGTNLPYITVEAQSTLPLLPPDPITLSAGGRTLHPFGGRLTPDGRLHRLNFTAPQAPFRIVAAPGVSIGAAYALSGSTRLSGKILGGWRTLLWAAALLAAAGTLLFGQEAPLRRWFGWDTAEARAIPGLLLIVYLAVAAFHLDTYAGGADSSGYLNSARLLRHGRLLAPLRRPAPTPGVPALPDSVFVPVGFALHTGPALAPTYPPGLPLLIAAADLILPEHAAVVAVVMAHLLAGIILLFRCSRYLRLSPPLATGLAAALALCPVYLFMGLQPMSDVPALVWVLLAVTLALTSPRPALCGIATAIAVLIRPSNVLALPAILVAFAASSKWSVRTVLEWAAGGLPFALAEAFYNHRLYGHALATGYGNPASMFQFMWLAPTLQHYVAWLPRILTPFIALALAIPFLKPLAPGLRLLLIAWIAPFLAFYAFYACTHETWWYLRFLLPAVPPLLIAAGFTLQAMLRSLTGPVRLAAAATVAITAAAVLLAQDIHLGVLDSGRGNRVYLEASTWLAAHTPPNALIVAGITTGALTYYTALPFATPTTPDEAAAIAASAAAARRPLYAAYFRFDAHPLAWFPGGWEPVSRAGDVVIFRSRRAP